MRRSGTHERRQVGGTRVLPPGTPGDSSGAVSDPSVIFSGQSYQWLEGLTGATIANGVISAYADRSPNNYSYSSSGGSQPAAETGGWDGLESIYGDGANDVFLNVSSAFATMWMAAMLTGTATMWIATQTIVAGNQCPRSLGTTASAANYIEFGQSTAPDFQVRKNGGALATAVAGVSDQLRHVWKLAFTTTDVRIYRDGVLYTVTAAPNLNTASPTTLDRDTLFAAGRNTLLLFARCRIACTVAAAASPAQVTATDAYMAKFYAANTKPMLIIAGDSQSLPATWQPALTITGTGGTTIVNVAVGGEVLTGTGGLGTQLQKVTSNYSSTRTVTVASMHYGTNDIALLHRTAAQLATDVQTWITTEKTAHPTRKVVVATIFKRGGATPIVGADETERATFNTNIRANFGAWGADYLLDRDNIITELPTDLTIFADEIHLTTLGNSYIAAGRFGFDGMNQILAAAGCV